MSEDVFKLPVLKLNGENINRNVDLTEFIDVKINEHLIYLAVKNYLANQRQGTHKNLGKKEQEEQEGEIKKVQF